VFMACLPQNPSIRDIHCSIYGGFATSAHGHEISIAGIHM
jgi:hypothetical protein